MPTPVDGATRRRRRANDDYWPTHLATRVVAEVSGLAGGGLRPQSAALLTDVTVRGYDLFVARVRDEGSAARPEAMAELVGALFADVDISLEDAMALHRHLEQVLLQEVRQNTPPDLAVIDPDLLETVAHRFFTDLAAALTDGYLAARREHDSARDSSEEAVLTCVLSSPPRFGEARRYARLLDVDLDRPWEVMVIAPVVASEPVPGAIVTAVRRALFGVIALVGPGPSGLVVAVDRGAGGVGWPDLGAGVVCTVGGTHADVRGIRESHDEALEALELARRKGVGLLRFEDAWFDRFLLGAVTADELADLVLEPVAALTPSRRAVVLETLEAYLDSGSSVAAVAEALHLHRQSVNYRMQNVRRLFGPRLMSPNGRLALHIAVKAARLQRRP
ncbi:MAG: hypothetical protein QOF40_1941 [Actinomycetota bacterium]|jgi:hypothetical protein|nr:hypothetical protein [Actinomycetota bacterium]